MRRIGDDEQHSSRRGCVRAAPSRERRLRHRARAVQAAVAVALLRLVAEDEHRLAGDVDAGVVVVADVWYREAVAGKDQRQALEIARWLSSSRSFDAAESG